MKWKHSVFICSIIFSLVGCTVDQGKDNQNQQMMLTTDSNQRNTINLTNSQGQGRVERYNESDQGLSEEYHGHISNRPEINKKQKEKPPAANNRLIQVQLLGINDLHGQLNITRRVAGRPVGRIDYLAAYLKQREAENQNTLLVQAGDMVGASPPISALLQDEPTIDILNRLGFDIGTVGNHEFDEGIDELLRLLNGGTHKNTGNFGGSQFPWIVANVVNEETGKTILPPHKVIKVNGMPIGFIGVVFSDTPTIVMPSGVVGLSFTDEIEAINKSVAELKKQGIKSIVVLAHNTGSSGVNGENPTGELVEFAKGVDDEVDIIFGGHNHAYMNATVDNKLLIQSYAYGTAFSDVDIEIDPRTKDIINKNAEIVTTFQEDIEPDPNIRARVEDYESRVEPIVNRVVGATSVQLTALQNTNGESVLGNLIADSQRAAMNTDFAFMNPGGIRADIDVGEITWGEIYTVQPFNNVLVKMSMTGQQILDLLNQQWGTKTTMLQISGLTYTWDPNQPVGQKVVKIQTTDGTEIDMDKTYTVTANAFLADGGDGFTLFRQAQNKEVGPVDVDALIQYMSTLPQPFTYTTDGRIQRLNY